MSSTDTKPDKPASKPPSKISIEDGIGLRLKAAREAKAFTHSDLHRITGLSRMVISKYESGQNKPGTRELRILCDALEVTPNQLIYGTENPHKDSVELVDLIIRMGENAIFPASIVAPRIVAMLGQEDLRMVLKLIETMLRDRDIGEAYAIQETFESFQIYLNESPEKAKLLIAEDGKLRGMVEKFRLEQIRRKMLDEDLI